MNTDAERLRTHGWVVIRQAIAAERLRALLPSLRGYFKALRQAEDRNALAADYYRKDALVTFRQVISAGYSEINSIQEILATSIIREILTEYFCDSVHMPLHHLLVHHFDPENYRCAAVWHQDITVVDPRAMITGWVPLGDCGVDAPGLEVVDQMIDQVLTAMNAEFIRSQYGDRVVHPSFSLGDVMLFSNTTPHRTYITEGMMGSRYSFDIRFIPRGALLPNESYSDFAEVRAY